VVFPVWDHLAVLPLVVLCTLILALASVVWGVGYITWFRKVLVFLVAIVFIFSTLSFLFPNTATSLRKKIPKIDQWLSKSIDLKRADGNLVVADLNYDGFVDSLDVTKLDQLVQNPKLMTDNFRGDVNGDSKIDADDVRYLENFLTGTGPAPRSSQYVQKQIPKTSNPDESEPRIIRDHVISPKAKEFFDLAFEEMEITREYTKVVVSWSNPKSNGENASIAFNTVLSDDQGYQYRLMSTKGVPLGGKVKLEYGHKITAELFFPPLQKNVKTAKLLLYDLWNNGPFIFYVHCNT
jgi:hypothetical protein